MTIADAASVAALAVDLVALYFLIGIWKDDRLMRIAAEESLKAQLEYLGLRRTWYAGRTKKRDEKLTQPRPEDGSSPNGV
jgi:hypothetical protein